MHLVTNADSLEYVTQSWWLASTRLHDIRRWAGGAHVPMRDVLDTLLVLRFKRDVLDTLLVLRFNEFSPKIADLADEAVQEMYARKGAVG